MYLINILEGDNSLEDNTNVWIAIHKDTHEIFGGKATKELGLGPHVGYRQKRYLKSAMTNAKVNHEDYMIKGFHVTQLLDMEEK
jgi:hypothetical protein